MNVRGMHHAGFLDAPSILNHLARDIPLHESSYGIHECEGPTDAADHYRIVHLMLHFHSLERMKRDQARAIPECGLQLIVERAFVEDTFTDVVLGRNARTSLVQPVGGHPE